MLYLAAPLVPYFLGFFRPVIGALLVLALLVGLVPWLNAARSEEGLGKGPAVAAVLVAVAWTALGGAGHWFYANLDWATRDAVLRDLTLTEWPPSYGRVQDLALILRCPVAYFLPAAALGKVLGVASADTLLFAWTAIGMALFLALALSGARTARQAAIGLLVIVLFSGMDLVGIRLFTSAPLRITDHLEWWAGRFQYSSHTTLLFWAPNHALPGWLVGALFYRNWRRPEFLRLVPIAIAVMPLWSPLPMLGVAPFLLLVAGYHLRRGERRWGPPLAWALPAALVFLASAAYLTLDSTRIPSGWAIAFAGSFLRFAVPYVLFLLLEFGVVALVLWRLGRDPMVLAAAATLAVLPLLVFGPLNDLVMRGSVPALTVLSMAAAQALAFGGWSGERRQMMLALAFVLMVGSATAFHEIARALLFPRWRPELQKNLVEVSRALPPHYVGRLDRPLLSWAFKVPTQVRYADTQRTLGGAAANGSSGTKR